MRLRKKFTDAAAKFLSGDYSAKEQEALSEWHRTDSSTDEDGGLEAGLPDGTEERLLRNIHAGIRQAAPEPVAPAPGLTVRPLWTRTWVQVAAMLTLAAGLLLVVQFYASQPPASATLVFRNTTSRPVRQVLPDGSAVWLNSQTELRLSEKFNQTERAVFLRGEAFFEIARNPAKPFTVDAGQISTRVLGTRFNVRAYDNDQRLEVSVMEGKVAVQSQLPVLSLQSLQKSLGLKKNAHSDYILTRDQKATFLRESGELKKAAVEETVPVNAWKDNRLVFEKETVEEVFKQISRKFNVSIVTSNEDILRCTVRVDLSGQSLETMMRMTCSLINAGYETENNRLIVTGEGCPVTEPDPEE